MTEISAKSVSEVQDIIQNYEIESNAKFRVVKKDVRFGSDCKDLSVLIKKVRFRDPQPDSVPIIPSDGTPFVLVGRKLLECHQGIDRDIHRKQKRRNEKQNNGDHDFTRKRRLIQPTKKKDCPVRIRIRHIIKFPGFKVDINSSAYDRDHASAALKTAIEEKKDVISEHRFYIALPDQSEHRNHLRGESASLFHSIDERLKEYLRKLVWESNITSVPQMKVMLEVYMKQSLFAGHDIPAKTNKRFWPSNIDIRNHIALAIKKQRNNSIDQEIVMELVEKWKQERPKDKFFLRLKGDNGVDDNIENNEECEGEGDVRIGDTLTKMLYGTDKKFLYVHQTPWQKRLLSLYGREISLLDATYRTTRYSLPLYFLCVPTNVNYINVATFVLETEDTSSLIEALQVIKEWNPDWFPKYFMSDYAEEEIKALEQVFPESFVYLCDFHREQSWDRWLSATHNGLHTKKSDVLELLRPLAQAYSDDDFDEALNALQSSVLWKENDNLRKWFEKTWLSCYKRWVRAYRQNRFNVSVNTNNGIERQNKSLKYEYLDKKKARSLSHLLDIILDKFIQDNHVKYQRMNVDASDQHKKYDDSVPEFLHNRPKAIVQHCMRRWIDSENTTMEDIDHHLSPSNYFVKSYSGINQHLWYDVQFGNDSEMPSCNCMDWMNYHLPCKHFMAVIRHFPNSWELISKVYRDNPYICIDVDSFPQEVFEQDPSDNDSDDVTEIIHISNADGEEYRIESLPIPSAQKIKQERSKICSLLEVVKTRYYESDNLLLLEEVSKTLTSLASDLFQDLPKECNLVLDRNVDSTYIGTNPPKRKKPKVGKTSDTKNRLPVARKRKLQWSGRHGVSAQKKRASYLKDGVDKILDSTPSEVTEEGLDILIDVTTEILAEDDQLDEGHGSVQGLTLDDRKGCAHKPLLDDQRDSAYMPLKDHLEGLVILDIDPVDTDRRAKEAEAAMLRAYTENMPPQTKTVQFANNVKSKRCSSARNKQLDCWPSGGLLNNGKNLCFANSILQCLRVTDLHKILDSHNRCTEMDSCVVCELKDFIQEGPITAEPLCIKMTDIWEGYRVGQQQDAEEFLRKLTEEVRIKCFGSDDVTTDHQQIIYGKQRSSVKCSNCNFVSSKDDVYTDISVSIDKDQSVSEAIRQYFTDEEVDWNCSSCLKDVKAVKSNHLTLIPKNFIVHLKRFNSSRRKVMKKVDHAHDLYLRSYVADNLELEDKAKLFAIIVHSGNTLSSGHYYAFIQFAGQWYKCNDMKVEKVTILSLQYCTDQPYLFFYRTLPRPYIS